MQKFLNTDMWMFFLKVGMAADPIYEPKSSVFDELGMRPRNKLSYKLDHYN